MTTGFCPAAPIDATMPACWSVSVEDVDAPLTDGIVDLVRGRRVHELTEVVVLRSGRDRAVVRVETEGRGLMREVVDAEVLAGPEETLHVEDAEVDVFNASRMESLRRDLAATAVVVDGRYGYTGVALPEAAPTVHVVDTVPPEPPRLIEMARGIVDKAPPEPPIVLEPAPVDATEAGADVDDPALFQCRISDLGSAFLDDPPELSDEEAARATVVGCPVSARIFKALYGRSPELIDVCPLSNLPGGPCLARCCKLDGIERDGDVVAVPWGASHEQVRQALTALAEDHRGQADGG